MQVVSGPLKGHKYIVKSDLKVLIGRTDEADIRIGYDDFCSRKHALMYCENNVCLIEDLNSTNGTFINGKHINGKTELQDGDIIGLGETELLVGVRDYPDGASSSAEDDIYYDD